MVNYSVVRLVVRPDAFVSGLETWGILMEVCNHTATTSHQSSRTIVFTTAAVGSVGADSRGLVDTAATILMLVAMLSSLACTGEPFKAELIFCDFHSVIYMVRPLGLEPRTKGL